VFSKRVLYEFGQRVKLELEHDAGAVSFDCSDTYSEFAGDPVIGYSFRHTAQYFLLSWRKVFHCATHVLHQ
jgi:hypothetical protein